MAKNKRQDRKQKSAATQAERGQREAQHTAMEAQAKSTGVSPGDVARKHREKRFGHN
ncbi:hypothetical protein SSP35_07_00870 [Streptomyces sp. NBRC 110611]|uniref:hypothetical protein n=1 Tax=Streptomyces sp. NBRC 110611 TaxID=1621259 RepID=UPI0008557634|nr:hypothetical protein [Streptomyces sp. NBRC 110611]GAU68285.1 hypothetical protein SSP35_07_00870 [Streptomyces sp. NBRC 110611]